ncbi:hypothetical protein KM295_14235 [Natronomonas sp. F2-12]|uniref:Uncharacterized protein n=1 Tax=Natronomonas aquatica TaxID=2841590 RepID=A0A9R1CW03_9EURY|nr:hypothetical protein [Natronomonas aquatica]MCQ4334614.1 hypothetical protein [Natronomonas aquatica]
MIRLSGGMLLVVVLAGAVLGVVVADQTDSAAQASLSMDYDTGYLYVGDDRIDEPVVDETGTPITNLSAGASPIADHPANVVDWSPWRVMDTMTRQLLQLAFWTATATAKTIHRSGVPVAWWVQGLELGVPGFAVGYVGLQVRSIVRGGRR